MNRDYPNKRDSEGMIAKKIFKRIESHYIYL